jgi:hypothetical protein
LPLQRFVTSLSVSQRLETTRIAWTVSALQRKRLAMGARSTSLDFPRGSVNRMRQVVIGDQTAPRHMGTFRIERILHFWYLGSCNPRHRLGCPSRFWLSEPVRYPAFSQVSARRIYRPRNEFVRSRSNDIVSIAPLAFILGADRVPESPRSPVGIATNSVMCHFAGSCHNTEF